MFKLCARRNRNAVWPAPPPGAPQYQDLEERVKRLEESVAWWDAYAAYFAELWNSRVRLRLVMHPEV